jgi:hypothetical protein
MDSPQLSLRLKPPGSAPRHPSKMYSPAIKTLAECPRHPSNLQARLDGWQKGAERPKTQKIKCHIYICIAG